MTTVMALAAVTLEIGRTRVLSELSLEVERGEVVALVGPSGAGKSSVLRVLLGLAVPQRGEVRLGGVTATSGGRVLLPVEERRLAVIFQDLALWPHLTVLGNLAFGLEAQRVPLEERERRISTMLERVGLAGRERRYPGELSGGERQRVAIARALVLEPDAVLLDEPLASLDVVSKRELMDLLRQLFRERGVAALHVTHDPHEASVLADRIAVQEQGRIVQSGTARELEENPATPFVEAFAADPGLSAKVNR